MYIIYTESRNHREQRLSSRAQLLKSSATLRPASPWLPNLYSSVSPSIARCLDPPPDHKFPDKQVFLACTPSFRAGGALGEPRWPSSVQTHSTLIPEHYAQGPICPPDITGLAGEVCLACIPGFRAGDALGGPGQPSVNLTGKLPNLGAHAS
eukprot:1160764-Pelagomonas_calceolata.AAC.5